MFIVHLNSRFIASISYRFFSLHVQGVSKVEQKGSRAQKIRSFYSGVSTEWNRMACTAQYLQVFGGNFLAAEPIDLVQVQRSSS